MDPRYLKPFATQSSRAPARGVLPMVPAAADGVKTKPKAKKAPPPDSDLATKRAHIIETKPGKKEMSAYFQSMVDEIALREDA